MLGLKNLFGKNVLGKGAFRLGKNMPKKGAFRMRRGVGATLVNFGRLCHRMHLPAGMLSNKCIGGAPTRALSPRRYQFGRSMIEMLAVLAIVGVLSVAAIAGLTWAFAKYKANNTIHDVHVWELAALDSNQLYGMTTGELVLSELGNTSTHGYPMAIQVQDKDVFSITVDDVPKRVCRRMLDMIDDTMLVTVNNIQYKGTDLCDVDENVFAFYFNKYMGDVSNICLPACTGEERCCNNACQIIQTPCGSDGCTDCGSDYCTTSNTCCLTPTATKCGSTDCCDTKCCNGVCCAESYMTCDETTTCGCPNNMVPDAQTGTCKCPDDAPYYFEEANLCCKSGYTPVDGVCQKIDCRGGTVGNTFTCYINDVKCGHNCTSEGVCNAGICSASFCPAGSPFMKLPGYYLSVTNYGCQHSEKNDCYYYGQGWACWNETLKAHCCAANSDANCTYGTCDTSFCDKYASADYNVSYSRKNVVAREQGSCWFSFNDTDLSDVQCYPNFGTDPIHPSSWICIDVSSKTYCDQACLNPPLCDGKCGIGIRCLTGFEKDENGYCCKQMETHILCTQGMGTYYLKTGADTYQICGDGCNWSTGVCRSGACSESAADCKTGFVYEYVSVRNPSTGTRVSGYGCVKNDMQCIKTSSLYHCRYGTETCGIGCASSDGSSCASVYMEECANTDQTTGKKICPYNKTVTDTCICDTNPEASVGELCCPAGHENVNGACALV